MLLKQSTARNIAIKVFLSTDHVSPATGKALTVTLSKDGGAFASGGSPTEIANGWYKIALSATDTNTLGSLVVRATCSGCDDAEVEFEVVAFDPQSATNLGMTNLDAAVSGIPGLVLGGDWTAVGTVAAYSLINVLRGLGTKHKVMWNSGTSRFDVYAEDGTTVVYHIVPTTDSSAQPIVGVTPA